tara:strand:+ start:1329 stop:1553 length:225 start_codon:yes stop_codon:yes gene_type:complete
LKPSLSEAPVRTGGIEARGFAVVLLAGPAPVAEEVVAAAELALVVAAAVALAARPELEPLPQPTSARSANPKPI